MGLYPLKVPAARWQAGWERVIVLGSAAVAFGWGVLLANVAQGAPHAGRPPLETLIGPYSLLWGAAVVALLAAQGAVFAALRLPRDFRDRFAARSCRAARAGILLACVVAAATVVLGVELDRPLPALAVAALGLAASLAVVRCLDRGRDGWAFASSAVCALAPVGAVGAEAGPRLAAGAASASTLELLALIVVPALPALMAVQAWMWWTFRGRVGARSAVFF